MDKVTKPKKDGGPAFPQTELKAYLQNGGGVTKREWYAAQAPITFEVVVSTYGKMPNMNNDEERAGFFAVWAFLRFEYADAMIAERMSHNL